MGLMRSALLWCSANRWMKERLPRYRFVQRAVRRFMPGTTVEAALAEAERLGSQGIATLLTCLGENVADLSEAGKVCRHYLDVIDKVSEHGLDAHLSVKLTHLGLDLDHQCAWEHVRRIARKAKERGSFVWIDMEQSRYVEPTLSLFRKIRGECDNVGVCLQACLYRTPADSDSLRSVAPHVRIVKGAYREPPDVAYPRKRDVDEAFFRLARGLMLECKNNGAWVGIATHDMGLVSRAIALAREQEIPRQAYEFEMLYGIHRRAPIELTRGGHRVRVLISYGEHWFPWYMRRLAERPANVLLLLRCLFS